MSRQIPNNRRLEPDERAYLLMRGEEARVKGQDERYPAEVEEVEESDDEDDEEGEDYSDWSYAQLTAEVKRRKELGSPIAPVSQKQADLAEALRKDDLTWEEPE